MREDEDTLNMPLDAHLFGIKLVIDYFIESIKFLSSSSMLEGYD